MLDTRAGQLLHESAILPQLYVPADDVRDDLLDATHHHTHCPFKGDASYWTVRAGGAVAENAAWACEAPREQASWLRGYRAFEFDAMDAWFDEDEDEEIEGHLRDPYHRVDVRASESPGADHRRGEVVTESDRPKLLSETGLPNRFSLPPDDVRRDLLEASANHSVCPYKGRASDHTLRVDGRRLEDAAWFYPQPLENALEVRDHLNGKAVAIEVDGERVS